MRLFVSNKTTGAQLFALTVPGGLQHALTNTEDMYLRTAKSNI